MKTFIVTYSRYGIKGLYALAVKAECADDIFGKCFQFLRDMGRIEEVYPIDDIEFNNDDLFEITKCDL